MNPTRSVDGKKSLFNPAVPVCLFLIIATAAVYWQVNDFSFVNLDDPLYVTGNRHVKDGLTLKNIIWAFTDATEITNYWAPLTWLSILLDFELYGMNAGGYHVTNLLFHLLNTLLLLFVFHKMTGDLWQSAFIAAMFSLHPLHVESVAWVTERKDVISTFFWILTMWAYCSYSKSHHIKPYLLAIFYFIMGLMAKPMLVTLPFVLLLLDFWPLRRLQLSPPAPFMKKILSLSWEKMPFFLLIPAASIAAFLTQQRGGVISSLSLIPISLRAENVVVSYAAYLWKMFWPFNLSAIYPYPESLPIGLVAASLCVLVLISAIAFLTINKAPWFIVGWLWYVGTLVPVIGIVVIGPHAMADRFTYVPLIGIFLIIAYGVPELLKKNQNRKTVLAAATSVLIACLLSATWNQVGYWRDSFTLFKHALEVTEKNPLAHLNMGNALLDQGDLEEARRHYAASLQIFPDSDEAHNNLGTIFMRKGEINQAIEHHSQALRINPDSVSALNNLGNALKKAGRTDEAIECYTKALKIQPDSAELNFNLGLLLSNSGRQNEAIQHFSRALQIDRTFALAHNSIGNAFMKLNQVEKAMIHFSKALETNPSLYTAHFNMGQAFEKLGKTSDAIKHFKLALQINTDYAMAHNYLGNLFLKTGEMAEAISHFTEALKLKPDYTEARNALLTIAFFYANQEKYDRSIDVFQKIITAQPQESVYYYNIACLYSIQNQKEASISWLKKAVEKGYDNLERIKTDTYLDNIRQSNGYKNIVEKMITSRPQQK